MNVLHMVGFSALLAMTVACASQAEPIGGTDGKQSSPVSGEPTDSPGPAPAPAPAPTPAPAPAPACTPLAKQTGDALLIDFN